MNIDSCYGCAYYDGTVCHVDGMDARSGCEKWREGFWHKSMETPMFADEEDE